MLKDIFLVGIGSFLGGSARYVVTRVIQSCAVLAFPFGTFAVNILGCLLIGFFSGLHTGPGWMNPTTKLILTTGFCGGFTTFSTFMNESSILMKNNNALYLSVYIVASLAIGLLAVLLGYQLAKSIG